MSGRCVVGSRFLKDVFEKMFISFLFYRNKTIPFSEEGDRERERGREGDNFDEISM